MKAILRNISDEDLARRRKLGLDHWDEMWEGVLHMAPAPAFEHQRIQTLLAGFLVPLFTTKGRGTIVVGVNVFNDASPSEDYRIPDFSYIAPGHESLVRSDGIHGEGLDAVIEIRSPGDETYDKLPFFARIGVREVVVVDRDSKRPEVFRLTGDHYLAIAPDREGWIMSEVLKVRLRCVSGTPASVEIEDGEDPNLRVTI